MCEETMVSRLQVPLSVLCSVMLACASVNRAPPWPGGFPAGPDNRAPEGDGGLEQEEALGPACLRRVPVTVTWQQQPIQ